MFSFRKKIKTLILEKCLLQLSPPSRNSCGLKPCLLGSPFSICSHVNHGYCGTRSEAGYIHPRDDSEKQMQRTTISIPALDLFDIGSNLIVVNSIDFSA